MLQRPNPLANRRRQAGANKVFRSTVKKYLALWIVLSNLSFWLIPTGLRAREPQIKVEQVLQATQSSDSRPYTSYPAGQPQVTVLRITIPPNTALHWQPPDH